MDLILDPCENRLHKDSMKYLNAPIRVQMRLWRPSQDGTVLDLISFFPWAKSDLVSWWRTLGILVLCPQSTSLVLHAFHVSLTLFLIHVCISENYNEHTSWCSINSSNTIMVKDCFTCESKVANVIVSRHVMSSSGPSDEYRPDLPRGNR